MKDFPRRSRRSERGQVLVIVGVAMIALLGMAGLVTDGGLAWANRRQAQNVADMAALAGSRIIAVDRYEKVYDPTATPTFADPGTEVQQAIQTAFDLNANPGQTFDALTWGVAGSPEYTDFQGRRFPNPDFATGGPLYVVPGAIPGDAQGVYVPASAQSGTVIIQVVGIDTIEIGVDATAVTGPSFPVGKLLPLVVRDRYTECINVSCTHTRPPIDGIPDNYQRTYQEGCLYSFRDTNPAEIECNGETDPDFPDVAPPDFAGSFGWIDWDGGNSPTSQLNPWITDPSLAPSDWYTTICGDPAVDVTCRIEAGSLPAPEDDLFWRLEGSTGNRNVSLNLTWTIYRDKEVYVPIWREAQTGSGTNAKFEIHGFGVFLLVNVVNTGSEKGFDGIYLGSFRGGDIEQCTIVPNSCPGSGSAPVTFAINLAR
ncbi:MAG: pilus assembly protein TadG-related protein [Candidatus Limnocylindria bacterium]